MAVHRPESIPQRSGLERKADPLVTSRTRAVFLQSNRLLPVTCALVAAYESSGVTQPARFVRPDSHPVVRRSLPFQRSDSLSRADVAE